jgi:hypothetical protein
MGIEQGRIRDLDTFIPLDPSDPDYVPVSAIYIALDSTGFSTKPKKYSLEEILSDVVEQKGRLTGLSSRSVSVTFGTAFSATPITSVFNVYRETEVVPGTLVRKNVKHEITGSTLVTTTGFAITIDASESLTGVVVEYKFEEAS